MDIYEKLNELGVKLPTPPAKGGLYTPAKPFGDSLVYVSGCGPVIDGNAASGKIGQEFTMEEGYEYARKCMLNALSVLESQIKDLNRVKNVVKILVFVASSDDFYMQPQVANGASQLLCDIFGEEIGVPSRSAIGVNVLPGNIPVEVEAIFELK